MSTWRKSIFRTWTGRQMGNFVGYIYMLEANRARGGEVLWPQEALDNPQRAVVVDANDDSAHFHVLAAEHGAVDLSSSSVGELGEGFGLVGGVQGRSYRIFHQGQLSGRAVGWQHIAGHRVIVCDTALDSESL